MKKAKIMLAAIAVLAIVGGALAFRAKTFTETYAFTCTPPNAAFNYSTCSIIAGGGEVLFKIDDSPNPEFVATTIGGVGKNAQPCDQVDCTSTIGYKDEGQ